MERRNQERDPEEYNVLRNHKNTEGVAKTGKQKGAEKRVPKGKPTPRSNT